MPVEIVSSIIIIVGQRLILQWPVQLDPAPLVSHSVRSATRPGALESVSRRVNRALAASEFPRKKQTSRHCPSRHQQGQARRDVTLQGRAPRIDSSPYASSLLRSIAIRSRFIARPMTYCPNFLNCVNVLRSKVACSHLNDVTLTMFLMNDIRYTVASE